AASSGTSGKRASSTVTGAVAQTRWGPVEVRLTIASKKITHVDVVQYPNGNPRDDEINQQALPILIQETISSQNANIDMVSGATVTSTGYLQSLQSALDKAGL
ncbi:MAG: FMN-binding protein, partial [Marmoricola sp.]|nr:FMN-binding protein [Marmoricola sp.]